MYNRGRGNCPTAQWPYRGAALIGLLTYELQGETCEILSLDADPPHQGTGAALIEAAFALARSHGCKRLTLITTNDNLDAMRFYQRRGFRLAAVYPDAIAGARVLKPSIPETGNYRIPIRDEVEFEMRLK